MFFIQMHLQELPYQQQKVSQLRKMSFYFTSAGLPGPWCIQSRIVQSQSQCIQHVQNIE